MKNSIKYIAALGFAGLSSIGYMSGTASAADNKKTYKVGVVSFLSGAAAGPFGIPTRNAAEIVIEAINSGKLPEPYNTVGFAGAKINAIYIDENSKQKVADYKKLVQKDKVDMVLGYNSSGSCKAIAPVAEEEKTLTLFSICGTPQIFEDIVTKPEYLFRTASHATMDNVAAARYILATNKKLSTIAGVNQNYAWGHDSWRDFSESMKVLKKDAVIATKQFPKIFAGQYGSEITSILKEKPSVVHSSFWGGDLEAFIIQAGARGIFSGRQVILTSSDTAIARLGAQIPNGAILGARGLNGVLAPDNALNNWFKKAYFDRFGSYPVSPAYQMAQAIFAAKAAADKAGSTDKDAVKKTLKGLEFDSPSGKVQMALSNGHQAIAPTAYGSYKFDKKTGQGTLVNVIRYKAACVNPPAGVKSIDWIKSGFKGASCD